VSATPEPTEFERVTLPLLGDCYAFALSLSRRTADAEDLVQETFLRAQRSFGQFQPGTNAKAWLFTILRRLHIDKHRRARVRPGYLPEEELEGLAPVPDAPPPPVEASEGVGVEDVRRALAEVPESFRTAVHLRDFDGLSYAEIGRILGVPPGTVMSRIHRGRECLKDLLVRRVSDAETGPPGAGKRAASGGDETP
jgi:RNA polymerase sigma-70 factor (ECF subfamily)